MIVITHYIDILLLAQLQTEESCPYCHTQSVCLHIRQKRIRTLGLSKARKKDKCGLALCQNCGNEIKQTRWSPVLQAFYQQQKSIYNLTFWQRYGFWVGWFCIWPVLALATWLYLMLRGW